jgi:hypothetical protein
VRFSNANTTTDSYRCGARPGFPQTLLDGAGVEEDDGCPVGAGAIVVVVVVLVVVARDAECVELLHAALNNPRRASIAAHRRHETTRTA